MKQELEEHALSIVLQLVESPDAERDGLRSQLCGDNAELGAAVAELWQANEAAERKQFWQHPADALLGPSDSSAAAQSGDHNADSESATQAAQRARQPKSARFIPIDRLGVGGQGEVWLMLDPQIDRRVAMKIVQPSQKGSEATLTSFRREAEVSGKLEHPNIVPVYDVTAELNESGQADPNSPCYVMRVFGDPRLHIAIAAFHERPRSANDSLLLGALREFDKDQSPEHREELKAQLAKLSFDPQQACDQTLKTATESMLEQDSEAGTLSKAITKLHGGEWSEPLLRKLLSRFQRICEGVAYAHSRGVIHRDLKPDNIMLGEYGETLVADWGLAKVVGRDEEHHTTDVEGTLHVSSQKEDSQQTRLGQLKGTPAYMSPEQAMGRIDELGPATDIYSLGAILYRLLTGTSAFSGKTVEEVYSRVRDGEFPRPTEVEPRVPKALEAIVLKAMSLKPRDRYAKALDLTADVERWLDDEPVSAWPEPFTVRARRWAKKHQTFVGSTAAAVLMAVLTLSVMFVVVTGQKAEIAATNQKLSISNRQLEQANAKERAATRLAETNATAASEQSQLALSTLNAVIFDIQHSLENVPGGATVRNRLLTSVLPQLDKVSTQFAKKSAIDRNTMFALSELAGTILQLGDVGHISNVPGLPNSAVATDGHLENVPDAHSAVLTAERLYLRAHEIGKQLAAAASNDTEAQRDLSVSFERLGDVFLKLGRTDDALTQFQDGLKIRRVLAEADPNDAQKQRDLSISFNKLGDVFRKLGRTDDALKSFNLKFEIDKRLAEADPNDAQKQRDLSISFNKLGNVFLKLGRTDEALTQFQDGLKIRRVLAQADPNDAQTQRYLSISFNKLGNVFLKLGRIDEALTLFQDGLKISRVLAEADPNDAQKQRDLAVSFERLGQISLAFGRTDDALKYFSDELVIAERWMKADPSDVDAQRFTSVVYNYLGDVFLKLGRTDEALTLSQDGLKISRVLAEADPNDAQKQRELIVSYFRLGLVHRDSKDYVKSVASFEAALQIAHPLKQQGLLAGEIDGRISALERERKKSEQLRDAP